MKLKEAIGQVRNLSGNAVNDDTLCRWLSELDGRLMLDFYKGSEWMSYSLPQDEDHELLVSFPWDALYVHYLEAMVYYSNGEFDRYRNSYEMFNKKELDYRQWYARNQLPITLEALARRDCTVVTEGRGSKPFWYLSAYALAVKHGFVGTEEEWLETLKGDKTELRYNEDANALEWKYVESGDWNTLMDLDQLQGEVVSETLAQATAAKEGAEAAQAAAEAAQEKTEEAAASVGDAEQAAQDAIAAAGTATAKAAEAAQSAQDAAKDAADAEAARAGAVAAQGAAETAEGNAEAAAGTATSAKTAAETAQGKAEDAQEAAETAQGAAEAAAGTATSAKTAAETAKGAAEAAQGAAETAQDAAETAAGTATSKASEAAQSAAAAAQDADDAEAKAVLAQSWAVGGTGTREGEDTNNAKYWSDNAQGAAGGGVTSFNGRSGAVAPQAGDYTAAMVGARPSTWTPSAEDVGARPDDWTPSAAEVGADPTGTAAAAVAAHNQAEDVHTAEFAKKADKAVLEAHTGNTQNPHGVTAAQVGARPDDWMPSASDVGARPDTWTPSAADVGADPAGTAASAVSVHNQAADAHNVRFAAKEDKLSSLPSKTALVDSDAFAITDSAASGASKRISWANIKTLLGQLFAPLSRTINGKALSADVTLTGEDIPTSADDLTTIATALSNKAPGGFGFGDELVEIRALSGDESYETFCAKIDAFAADMPNNTAALVLAYPPAISGMSRLSLTVLAKGSNDYIVLRNLAWGDVRGFSWQMMRARYPSSQSPSVWLPFEWGNPPLQLGVEYRTVERYGGKPVYVQSINFGALPNASSKSVNHNIESYGGIVSYDGRVSYYNLIAHPGVDSISIAGGTITIVTNANLSAQSAIITLKYTKTTD